MALIAETEWPQGIVTYDSESEKLARQLARSPKPVPLDRQRLGEQLIRESTAAMEQLVETIRRAVDRS